MNNKILVIVYVPLLEESYNIFVPVSKKVGVIKKLLEKEIDEIKYPEYSKNSKFLLYNRDSNINYNNDVYIKNTDIRNGTKLILL
jgi:hypothetical protein